MPIGLFSHVEDLWKREAFAIQICQIIGSVNGDLSGARVAEGLKLVLLPSFYMVFCVYWESPGGDRLDPNATEPHAPRTNSM